jgi:hypothetical protein
VEIPYTGEEEEEIHYISIIEEPVSPTHTRYCVKSMTPSASPQSGITIEYLSKEIVVSQEGPSSSSQSSGNSA